MSLHIFGLHCKDDNACHPSSPDVFLSTATRYMYIVYYCIVVSRLCDMKVKTKTTTYRYTFQHIISQIVKKHFFFLELQVW